VIFINSLKKFLAEKNIHFFMFYKMADTTVQAVVRHSPGNIPAENITVAVQEIDYDVINVKQMTDNVARQKDGSHTPPFPSS
jgi:hypothetical protein